MNYNRYTLTAREWIVCIGEYIIIISGLAYLFFDSIIGAVILAPFIAFFIKFTRSQQSIKQKEELEKEFLKALLSLSASLAAGLSIENSFIETQSEMEKLFGLKSCISKEISIINKKISSGERIEDALSDFAKRSGIAAIEDFSLIFGVARRSGGNLPKVISQSTEIMERNRQTVEESRVLIRGKQYEQKIMNIIPLGIIFYFRVTSSTYVAILYHNFLGTMVMSICLGMYVFAVLLAHRICDVRID